MKYIFQELTENEVFGFTQKQLKEKTREIKKIYEALSRMSVFIVEKRFSEIVINYDIKTISIEPYYMYDDNIVKQFGVFFKDAYNRSLKEKIYNELEPFKFILTKDLNFYIPELKIKNTLTNYKTKFVNNRKYIFQELTKEEIFKLTPEQLETKIEEIKEVYGALKRGSEIVIGKRLGEIVSNSKIEVISIEPYYLYNTENFADLALKYIIRLDDKNIFQKTKMVPKYFEDAKRISYYDLGKKIGNELELFKFLITQKTKFDVFELRAKHTYFKLKKDLSIRNLQTKSLCHKI